MNLTSLVVIKELLKKRGLQPLKRLGQNFLIDRELPQKLIVAAQINDQDTVLEIGPGIGAITQELAKRAERVVAVEKDREMIDILKETLAGFENVEIIQEDIRESDFPFYIKGSRTPFNYKVVGNLPFYLTAPVIRQFLESVEDHPQQLQSMVLVVQKEVGQRICAKPPKMSILANAVQFYAEAEIISYVPKKSFWPQPKVDAAIIKIVPNPQLARNVLANDKNIFFKIMKAGFSHPRKQLLNNLAQGLKKNREDVAAWLQKNGIESIQRAETLSVDDWVNLTKSFVL